MYGQNEWISRVGTGLNKWRDSITNELLELSNEPDSIIVPGTPFQTAWMNNLEKAVAQTSDYKEPDSVVSQLINITTPSDDVTRFYIDVDTIITGGAITINRNGGGALSLYSDYALTEAVTELEPGVYEIIDRLTAFYLRPKGSATSFGAYVKYEGLNKFYEVTGGATSNFGDASVPAIGQSFTTPSSGNMSLNKISFFLDAFSNPPDGIRIEIYNASGDLPTGPVLATSDNIVAGSAIQASPGDYEFTFTGFSFSPNTKYTLVVQRSSPGSAGTYRYQRDTGQPYAGGTSLYQNSGLTWLTLPSDQRASIFLGQEQATLQTDAKDAEVKTNQIVMSNHAVFIDDGGSGQTIPSVDNATNETQLTATVDGTLKTDTSYTTERQVIASVFKNSQGFTPL